MMDMTYNADSIVVLFDDADARSLTESMLLVKRAGPDAWSIEQESLYQALRTWTYRPRKKPGVVQDNSTRIYYLYEQEQAPDRDYIERLRR